MGQLGDLSPQSSVAIGIVVGLLSTSIQSFGLTLQRKSHLDEDAKDIDEIRRPPYKRRKWQLGMFMFVVSNLVGSTIQITTLPLPVLSTLQASGLVFNTAFATLLLQEPFTRYSLIGTILTCAGAGLIATFGAIGEPAHNLSQLLELLEQADFIIWMVGTLTLVVVTIVVAHLLKVWSSRQHIEQYYFKSERPRSASSASLLPSGRRKSFTASLPRPLQLRVSRLRMIRGLAYGLISGILSAHSLLVAKSAVELLVRTIVDHNNQFNRFQSWLILVALLFFALSQLYYLHLGLRLCSTSVLYPFVFCAYNIIAILDGLIYFQQASRLSVLHACLVALGTLILLGGVFALSWRLDDTPPDDVPPVIVPPTPLAPGMSIVRADDSDTSLPSSRKRSSTGVSRRSVNEYTSLLRHPTRGASVSIIPPSEHDTKDIWAELDDEDDGGDYLSSLPRAPFPFLKQTNFKTRSRSRGSLSSQVISSSSRRSSDGEYSGRGPSPFSKGKEEDIEERPKSSGPTHSRKRSASVRFAEPDPSPHPPQHRSRWDGSGVDERDEEQGISGQRSRSADETRSKRRTDKKDSPG